MTCIFENSCVIYITVLDSQREPESDAVMATLHAMRCYYLQLMCLKFPLVIAISDWGILCPSILFLYACL